jgi:phytoene synthase
MPVATLYLFCRTVDEIADRLVLDVGPAEALLRLREVETALESTLLLAPPHEMLWKRLAAIHEEYGLADAPMRELISGARWDLEGRPVNDVDDLVEYSNLVGGSIGAMMLPLLGDGRTIEADKQARDLGIGMQITNIIRDVGEDLKGLSRSYIPTTLADEFGVDPSSPSPASHAYQQLMEHLMSMAEAYFASGLAGIDSLPPAMRSGIRAATRFYRQILNEVRHNVYDNISKRAYVPGRRKFWCLIVDDYERRRARLIGEMA